MSKTILLCEDDEGIIDVTRIVLEEKGYNVFSFNNSIGILDIAEKMKPDLIILDLWMPDITGEETAIILKANKNTKNIPVIFVSASKDLQRIATSTKVDDFLAKPFDIVDLENIVVKNLNKALSV